MPTVVSLRVPLPANAARATAGTSQSLHPHPGLPWSSFVERLVTFLERSPRSLPGVTSTFAPSPSRAALRRLRGGGP